MLLRVDGGIVNGVFDGLGPLLYALLDRQEKRALRQLMSAMPDVTSAAPDELTFLDNPKYVEAFSRSRAGAAFVDERMVARAPSRMALLLTPEPYKAFARAAQAFYPASPVTPRRAGAGSNRAGPPAMAPSRRALARLG